jgi:hypothetical protein
MKITRLPRGNAQFPSERDPGDLVVLSNGDAFAWCRGIWTIVGGRFLKPEVREWFLDYLKDGWPTPSEASFDLGEMMALAGANKEDRRWTQLTIDNISKISDIIQSERVS